MQVTGRTHDQGVGRYLFGVLPDSPNDLNANGAARNLEAALLRVRAGSLYRAHAGTEEAAADDGLPLRPKPVRIRRPQDPLTPKEINLRERLQIQPHPNTAIGSWTP